MKEHQIITDGLLVKLLDLYRKELETISSDVEYTSAYLATLIFANLTKTEFSQRLGEGSIIEEYDKLAEVVAEDIKNRNARKSGYCSHLN